MKTKKLSDDRSIDHFKNLISTSLIVLDYILKYFTAPILVKMLQNIMDPLMLRLEGFCDCINESIFRQIAKFSGKVSLQAEINNGLMF
jgi:hypothetical protein